MSALMLLQYLDDAPARLARVALNDDAIARYMSGWEGARCPPVRGAPKAEGPGSWVYDGAHRMEAVRRANALFPDRQSIEVDFDAEPITQAEAERRARLCNQDWGVQLSRADLAHRAKLVLDAEEAARAAGQAPRSSRDLAAEIGCSKSHVGDLWAERHPPTAATTTTATATTATPVQTTLPTRLRPRTPKAAPTATTGPTLAQLRDQVEHLLTRANRLGVETFTCGEWGPEEVGLWCGDIDDEPRERLTAALAGLEAACESVSTVGAVGVRPEAPAIAPGATAQAKTAPTTGSGPADNGIDDSTLSLQPGAGAVTVALDPTSTQTLEDLDARDAVIGAFRALVAERDAAIRARDFTHEWYATRIATITAWAKPLGHWNHLANVLANDGDPPTFARLLSAAEHRIGQLQRDRDRYASALAERIGEARGPEDCTACSRPTMRIEAGEIAYSLCADCAVQARDEMIADLRSRIEHTITLCVTCGPTSRCDEDRCCLSCGRDLIVVADSFSAEGLTHAWAERHEDAPSHVLPLTKTLLRRIVELLDADDVSMRNRGIRAGAGADRLDIHRFGETLTLSEPFSVVDFRAALAEIEAACPVPPSKPDGDPIREELERLDCMDLVGRLPDQEIGGLVSRDGAEVTAWREALGIPLAMHLQPEATPDAEPVCEDCPIGGRDGSGPTCPQTSDRDRDCAEHAAAYADERDPTPEEVAPATPGHVAVFRYGLSDGGDRSTNEDCDDTPESAEPATLAARLEALLSAGVENLPPVAGDGPTHSVAGCLFSLAVYGDDVLADLAARAEVAEQRLHEAVLSEARPYWWQAPLLTLLAELPEAIEVVCRIPSSWARLYPQGKIPSEAERTIRRTHAAMSAGDWQRTRPHWRELETWHGDENTLVQRLIAGMPEEESIAFFTLLRGSPPDPKMKPALRQELLTASILRHRRPLGAALPAAS